MCMHSTFVRDLNSRENSKLFEILVAAWRALSHVVELVSFKTIETSDHSETFLMNKGNQEDTLYLL